MRLHEWMRYRDQQAVPADEAEGPADAAAPDPSRAAQAGEPGGAITAKRAASDLDEARQRIQSHRATLRVQQVQQSLPLDLEPAQQAPARPAGPKETREDLLSRLLDPLLTLRETATLLGVCPTTVRRYTNRGMLAHIRTGGNQRRFQLSQVLEFMDRQAEVAETAGGRRRGTSRAAQSDSPSQS